MLNIVQKWVLQLDILNHSNYSILQIFYCLFNILRVNQAFEEYQDHIVDIKVFTQFNIELD